MKRKHVIVAPHADDEIIGCHSILESGTVDLVTFPVTSKYAVEQARISAELYGYSRNTFDSFSRLLELVRSCSEKKGVIFLPDFTYEFHPDHKLYGAFGLRLFKEGFDNVIFYSTNMNAPYIHEVDASKLKKKVLDECYPGKSDLWKYDHKYFLFEGYTRWILKWGD